jgi:transcriptional regulator with XRE-family HTH domain
MDSARERARRRLVAFFERDGAPTQEAFAEAVGYSQSWVSKILSRGPKLEDLDAIAAAMGVSVGDLIAARDLPRHTKPVERTPSLEEVPVATAAPRVFTVDGGWDRALAAEVRKTIAALSQLSAALDREAAAARDAAPRSARRHRKTG